MNSELRQALDEVAHRIRQFRLWSLLTMCWSAWAVAGLLFGNWVSRTESTAVASRTTLLVLCGLVFGSAALCVVAASRAGRNRRWIARRVEAKYSELSTGLLAAVEEDASQSRQLGFLQSAVIRDALVHRHLHRWDRIAPTWMLRGSKLLHAVAFICLAFVAFSLVGETKTRHSQLVAAAEKARSIGLTVEPGDVEIERGTPLLVVARFGSTVPADAILVTEAASGEVERHAMTRHLEDPLFAGRVNDIDDDLSYKIEYEGLASDAYRVKTFEYPRVVRTDADLNFPSYTSLAPKSVEDVRHVTAVEGTDIRLRLRLNKSVTSATLSDDAGEIVLTPQDNAEHVYAATLKLSESRKLTVKLLDADGRANKISTQINLNVIPNRPPAVVAAQPAHDVRVSPIEELSVKAKVEDDFGIVRHGVTYALAGRETKEVVLEKPPAESARFDALHLLDFEAFATSPDELVTYYFWAEDVGPDGEPRRTSGDMYFAEVRPFEEIFRQGEQQAGGPQPTEQQQGGNSNGEKAMELAELQKQIINATWKLVRRETIAKPIPQLASDSTLIAESERTAIEQANALAEKLQAPESQAHLDRAIDLMNAAAEALEKTASSASVDPLESALAAEQAAYQALLKLRDREFNVTRNQSSQQSARGASAGSPSQQQLQQLELQNDENRYEERSTARDDAATPEDEAQREMRQVLSRLNELAQRQSDLNERLKEMQAALEAAEDEETRQELARQLKRLREQQQEILRDTDELRERMEQEQNRQRMAEARQAVEESREHVRQASEALEEGQLSQALTEGTRADRQFEETREELRTESSNQLAEQMNEMRDAARQLDETQDALSEALEALADNPSPSLRQNDEREKIREGLDEQRERLAELVERLRETVQQAEEDEPLVAEKLYEAVRRAEADSIPEALDASKQLTELGVAAEAGKASRYAGEALDRLREGVEQAAESLLGDETAALRRARGELDDLAEQIDREIDPSAGRSGDEAQSDEERTGSAPPRRASGRGGENRADEEETGQQSPRDPSERGNGGEQGERENASENEGERREATSPAGQGTGQQQQRPEQGRGGQGQPQGQSPGEAQSPNDQENRQSQDGQGGQPGEGRGQANGEPNEDEAARQGDRRGAEGQAGSQGGGRGGSPAGLDQLLEGLGPVSPGGPITGGGFREWSDRMRDVEELVNDPELRAEAARIRDRVRGAREDFVRHSKEPDPKALQEMVAEPIRELRNRVAGEVRKRENPESLVPIDRDPVPPAFVEDVRRYYERLGSGR
ncbi:MAG: hypothetical protein H0T47_10050 [Planctomycetaceae bacterium]|nr:hypothetical protein [Planctomycetaceae bacterium]